ncbi:MAG TPA: Hint domain-containing protein [Bradyrhizobium sp.]
MDVNHTTDIYGISLTALGTPPTISLDPVAGDDRIDASENSKNLTVSGASDAIGGNVALVIDGNTFSNIVVGDNGTWSTTIDSTQLIDGPHQFRATVTNATGATGSVGDLVAVDTTAPTVVLSSDTTHFAVGQPVTVTATFSEAVHLGGPQYFEVGTDVTVTNEGFINDHTYAATFTPDSGLAFLAGFEVVINPGQVTDAGGNDNTDFVELTIGRSFDGYIVGGTVRYANGSGNGASATTGADGGFSLSGGNGPLVMTGGTDSATGLAFTGVFYAPDGASVVSPLTTLIEKVIEAQPADSVAQANALVASALGLPTGIDLTSLDAVAGALSGDASSTAAFKVGSELLDVLTLIQAAGGSSESAYWALVGEITAGTSVDLTDAATINAIGQSAGLGPAAAQAVASIASATDAALKPQLAGTNTPFDVVVDITGASIAEQGDASNALSHAHDDTSYQQVADSYVQDLAATLSQDDLTATDNVACYCPGTLIATDRGEVAVEDLKIGDGVVVMSGALRPIKWIGTRSYGGRFILGRTDILPICFKAGSLGDNVPKRDLWISPHHAMYLDGVLIEARDLVNGVSIVRAERVEKVEYFHIELDSHDVILAEGALSETFVDDDSRGMFHNAHEYGALYPDTVRVAARYCAKRCADGYEVEAARRRIDARAGLRPIVAEVATCLRGFVDAVDANCIAGWAQNPEYPEAPVCLDIFADGRLIGQTLANRFRDDLAQAGIGSGRHGFEFVPPLGLVFAASSIEVRRSIDGARLALSIGAAQVCGGVRRKAA